jgi:phosphohistidine phosphatase
MQHLLVVRHAIAEDRERFARRGECDDLRPLSAKGKRRFRDGARGLAGLVERIDLLVASPLVRARQTADLLAAAYREAPPRDETDALRPGAPPRELADWLAARAGGGRDGSPGDGGLTAGATVAVVGHEPHLSALVAWLVTGSGHAWIRLKKGSAVLLELHGTPSAGGATLLWALEPRQLRRLAG